MFNPNYPERCFVCYGPLPPQSKGRPRRTCSDACRQRRSRRNRRDRTPLWELELARGQRAAKKTLRKYKKMGVDLNARVEGYSKPLGWRLNHYLERGFPVRHCVHCHHPFFRDGVETEFCGDICRDERQRLTKAIDAWKADPAKAYVLDPLVDLYLRTGQPIRVCPACGKPFPVKDKRRITCSDVCRSRHHRSQKPKMCKQCGTVFEPRRIGGSPQKYCTPACRETARLKRDLQKSLRKRRRRACKGCGELFKPTRKGHVFHSPKCQEKARERATPLKPREDWQTVRRCPHCGWVFVPEHPLQTYHSPACKRAARNARRRETRAAGIV